MKVIDKKLISELEEKLLESMKTSDIKALDDMLHDDLLFVIPTGQTVTKEIDLSNLQSGNLKIAEILQSEQEISLIDDCAIVSVVIDLKGDYLGQAINEKIKYIRTWKLFDNEWKVIGGAGVQIKNVPNQ